MNGLQIFDFKGAAVRTAWVRTATEKDEPVFCLADVCGVLEIANPRNCVSRLSAKGVYTVDTPTDGGVQSMTYISEQNLYKLVFQSRKPEAEAFADWVTGEVLPAIRRQGGYMVAKADETPEETMARAILLAKDTIDRQKKQIAEQSRQIAEKTAALAVAAPKVAFADAFCASTGDITVANFAKSVCQALGEKKFGQKVMYQYLYDNGYLTGTRYPTQRAAEMGVIRLHEKPEWHTDGTPFLVHWCKITPKGQTYFFERLRDEYNKIGRWW